MKNKTVKFLSLCLISGALLTNCAKSEAGPKGDKGDPGTAGAAGPTGPTGATGTAGNANVRSSSFTNLTWTYNNLEQAYEATITYTAITQDIVDNGAVLVYYISANGNNEPLPASAMYDASTIVFWNYYFYLNSVKLSFHSSELDNSISPTSSMKFKVVAMAASGKPGKPTNTKTSFVINAHDIIKL